MNTRALVFTAIVLCFLLGAGRTREQQSDTGLTVHEWGTFTSIAGARGQAVVWQPQLQKDDLPTFVEHLRNNRFKGGLSGTVRMETPVLYFHATHPATVSVHVNFSDGLLTEWYPHAVSDVSDKRLASQRPETQGNSTGLTWNSISIDPGASPEFPMERAASRYYAARETFASPLTIKSPTGNQYEKFLFYRGVASFRVPVSAIPMNDGHILVSNLTRDSIPQAILFERRGDKLGYRYLGAVGNSSIAEAPELNSDLESLTHDLEKTLVGQGLFADEAHAMVETWKDSWFEEGTRLLYILQQNFVDSVLPLKIQPEPASTLRVFVGRMEVVTPATEKAIETALSSGDRKALTKYGRFLVPILQTMIARSTNQTRTEQLTAYLDSAYRDAATQLAARN
jgi:hypothetical protein